MKEVVIYNRTSTEMQNPENQLKECIGVALNIGHPDYEIVTEQKSAWKDHDEREKFKEIIKEIKRRKVKIFIVWDLDRIYRDRKKLIAFFEVCKMYGCQIYSFRQRFLEDINKAPAPWNELLFNQLIFIMGWIAEEESTKKSERVKAAVRKDKEGVTISKEGNKWGRREIRTKVKNQILQLHSEGKSMRQITREVFYWDKNSAKKFVSLGVVHKVISAKGVGK